jgi:hypothetical protein
MVKGMLSRIVKGARRLCRLQDDCVGDMKTRGKLHRSASNSSLRLETHSMSARASPWTSVPRPSEHAGDPRLCEDQPAEDPVQDLLGLYASYTGTSQRHPTSRVHPHSGSCLESREPTSTCWRPIGVSNMVYPDRNARLAALETEWLDLAAALPALAARECGVLSGPLRDPTVCPQFQICKVPITKWPIPPNLAASAALQRPERQAAPPYAARLRLCRHMARLVQRR